MNKETWHQALQTLEELVLDAGEAVSYRRLAGELCLHVNSCKALLQEFVDAHGTAHGLKVSVLVCGTSASHGTRVVLCPLAELESMRASLKPIIFEHIYAISRASAALEAATLASAAGGFNDFTPTIGAISSESCAKRSQKEITCLKTNSYIAVSNGAVNSLKTENKVSQKEQSSAREAYIEVSKENVAADVKKKSSSECKALEPDKRKEHPLFKTELDSSTKVKPKSNISNFFNKSDAVQAGKVNSNIKAEPKKIKKETEDKRETDEDCHKSGKLVKKEDKKPQKEDTNNKTQIKPHKQEIKKEIEKKKVVLTVNKNSKVDKKRKRVLRISDSEDSETEDPFEEEKNPDVLADSDDDVIPPTPNADVVKVTSATLNPKKRRKMIDRTYTTEDGYMVTKKEEILESCSEEEVEMKENIVETNVKKENFIEKTTSAGTPKSKKKPSPQKGKQASIMNFFKKKP